LCKQNVNRLRKRKSENSEDRASVAGPCRSKDRRERLLERDHEASGRLCLWCWLSFKAPDQTRQADNADDPDAETAPCVRFYRTAVQDLGFGASMHRREPEPGESAIRVRRCLHWEESA